MSITFLYLQTINNYIFFYLFVESKCLKIILFIVIFDILI